MDEDQGRPGPVASKSGHLDAPKDAPKPSLCLPRESAGSLLLRGSGRVPTVSILRHGRFNRVSRSLNPLRRLLAVSGEIRGFRKIVPQRLKPRLFFAPYGTTQQLAGKGRCGWNREEMRPPGAKAPFILLALSARLKPSPDTKPSLQRAFEQTVESCPFDAILSPRLRRTP